MTGGVLHQFITQNSVNLLQLGAMQAGTLAAQIGIKLTAIGPDFLIGSMPVDERTVQPFGILHGGASIALAETLGSIGSFLLVSGIEGVRVAGVEVSGSHLRPALNGIVTGLCRPMRIGRTLHFWQIDIRDQARRLCCAAKLTVSIILPRNQAGTD